MSFFGGIGNAVKGAAQTAVGVSPYVAQALATKKAQDDADQQRMWAQYHAQNQDRRAEMAQGIALSQNLANVGLTNARTASLQNPQTGVKYLPADGGTYQAVPVKVSAGAPITPVDTGIKAPVKAPPKIDPNSPQGIDAAGQRAGKVAEAKAPYAKPVAQSGVFVSDPSNPNGPAVYTPKDQAFGRGKPMGGMTGGMGSGGIGGLMRSAGGVTEMEQADKMMRPFEENARSGKANYNGLDYFQGQMAKMYDAHGKIDQAIHSAVFANLNKVNPDLANYLKSGEAYALGDGAVSGKTSDFRTKMDAFVNSIGPNATGANIDNTQNMRSTRLNEYNKFKPALEGAVSRFTTPSGAPGKAPASSGNIDLRTSAPANGLAEKYQKAVQHLQAQGKSSAEIQQVLGPPPGAE